MDFRQLELFMRVAQEGSFSRAAVALGVGQPYLSKQIRQMEVEIRKTLFHRHGRGIVLTDAGEQFLAFAKSVLHQYDAARQMIAKQESEITGRASVGMPPSLGRVLSVPLVKAFSERFPRAQLSIVESLSVSLCEQLITDKIDAALVYDPRPSSLLDIHPIVREPLCLISRLDPEDELQRPLSLKDLSQYRLIFPSGPHPLRAIVEAEGAKQGLELQVTFEVDGVESILSLVKEGYGAAVVPFNVVRAGMQGGDLRVRTLTEAALVSEIAMALPARRTPTLLAAKIPELILQICSDTLVGL
ncbi:MAG: LysR family transcriptional regulator [Pigmentiphaga sp.]